MINDLLSGRESILGILDQVDDGTETENGEIKIINDVVLPKPKNDDFDGLFAEAKADVEEDDYVLKYVEFDNCEHPAKVEKDKDCEKIYEVVKQKECKFSRVKVRMTKWLKPHTRKKK